ncbi:MAG: hypothetical protein ACTHX2_01700 [Microbacterium sp.]
MGRARAVELRPDAEEAQECWTAGVQPLIDAYGAPIAHLLRAILISHRANFPVPVFITGPARGGAATLLHAVAELTGDWPILAPDVTTLPALRLAANYRSPLLVENAAPAAEASTPSMFEQISDEMLDYGSPLQEVSILVATGGRRLGRELRSRVLHIPLPPSGPTRAQKDAVSRADAAGARRLVQTYMQQTAPRRALPATARRALRDAADEAIAPGTRCELALEAADALHDALHLPPLRLPDDPVLEATRTALKDELTRNGTGARLSGHIIYALPDEILPAIRAAADDPTIKHFDVARSLEVARMLATQTTRQAAQGSTTPTRIGSRVQRAWRIRAELID